jgi:hypothetical protein
VVVVDHGTGMQPAQVAQVEVDVLVQTVPAQVVVLVTVTLVQTTAVIQIWVAALLPDKDSQAAQALDLTVKAKTVTKQVAVVEQVDLDSVQKMTATKAAWAKVVQEQPTIF